MSVRRSVAFEMETGQSRLLIERFPVLAPTTRSVHAQAIQFAKIAKKGMDAYSEMDQIKLFSCCWQIHVWKESMCEKDKDAYDEIISILQGMSI